MALVLSPESRVARATGIWQMIGQTRLAQALPPVLQLAASGHTEFTNLL